MNIKYIMILLFACTMRNNSVFAQQQKLTLKNPLPAERTDELIVLKRSMIEKKTGKIATGKFAVLKNSNGQPLVAQYDDLNKDGIWDELVFLQNFKANESVTLTLSIADASAAVKAVVRSHARQKRKFTDDSFGNDLANDSIPAGQLGADFTKVALPPFLTEGPAWENDKVGFRIYFDVRNGKDIWGKTTSKMMMDEVGLDTANNYHKQSSWGMDILKVGTSLGAGSLAMQLPLKNGKDTLVRLGNVNMGKVVYEKIADGPVRAIIRLHYPEWKVLEDLVPVDLTEEISIWGGQYFYESKISVAHAPANARLVTGIVNLHSKKSFKTTSGTNKILYSFNKQSENQDELGLGIIISNQYFSNYFNTPNDGTDVKNTYALSMHGTALKPVAFRFYSGWGKTDARFLSAAGFGDFLKSQSIEMASPILIK